MSAQTVPSVVEPSLSEAAVEQGTKVMPMYIVLDVSGSMHDVEHLLNQVPAELRQLAVDEPDVADVAYMGIIGFSSAAQVLVPLGDIREATIPVITTGGGTSYSAAWELLDSTIAADVARLKADGFLVFRPLVWMLTDGEPQDPTWQSDFARRFGYDPDTGAGNKMYPRVVPIGFRDARMDVLSQLAYPAKDGLAYLSKPGVSPTEAFRAVLQFICRTTVSTGRTATSPTGPSHVFPKTLPGYDSAPSQYAGGDWL